MKRPGSFGRVPLLVLMGLWSVASPTPGLGQDSQGSPSPGGRASESRDDGRNLAENAADFVLWKHQAQLELMLLQAQVDAKKAEIERREAVHRIRQLAPTQAILAKLEVSVSMSFASETPLEDVLKYIKSATQGPNDTGIPIYVDPDAMQEARKTMTSPVTLDLEGVPLKTTLRLLLKQLGLVYKVEDGLLTISKP